MNKYFLCLIAIMLVLGSCRKVQESPATQTLPSEAEMFQDVHDSIDIASLEASGRLKASSRSSLGYTYNRVKAIEYAFRWGESGNPKFFTVKIPVGLFCTYFVSQCVLNGGFTMIPGNESDYTKWWYTSPSQFSKSWSSVNYFYCFLKSSGRGKLVAKESDLKLGDVIQADWTGDGDLDHTVIVTGTYKGKVSVTYHSTNTVDISLDDFKARAFKNKGQYPVLYFWSIQ